MFKLMSASDCMSDDESVVHPETELLEAINLLLSNKLSGVTVVNKDGEVVGMLSELDCLRAILKSNYHQEPGGLVADYMTTPCETVDPNEDVISLAQSMLDNKRRRRPVARNGKFEGVVSCRQLLRVVRDWQGAPNESKSD